MHSTFEGRACVDEGRPNTGETISSDRPDWRRGLPFASLGNRTTAIRGTLGAQSSASARDSLDAVRPTPAGSLRIEGPRSATPVPQRAVTSSTHD